MAGEVLRAAARHKLHIQFHGSYKPTGEQRTFPNLFNREGVLNLEYLKWSDMATPPHSVNVAYTRLLAGPVDYHLGGFRAAVAQTVSSRAILLPLVLGTRCNQLALYVVFENPMPMVADDPSAYEGQPGFDFSSTCRRLGTKRDSSPARRANTSSWLAAAATHGTWAASRIGLRATLTIAARFPRRRRIRGDALSRQLARRQEAERAAQEKRTFQRSDALDVTLASGRRNGGRLSTEIDSQVSSRDST